MENEGAGLEGFEPPASGLEARRSIRTKPQAPEYLYLTRCLMKPSKGMGGIFNRRDSTAS